MSQRVKEQMKRDAEIHANGRFTPRDREDVNRIVEILVNRQFAVRVSSEVETQVNETIKEIIN